MLISHRQLNMDRTGLCKSLENQILNKNRPKTSSTQDIREKWNHTKKENCPIVKKYVFNKGDQSR